MCVSHHADTEEAGCAYRQAERALRSVLGQCDRARGQSQNQIQSQSTLVGPSRDQSKGQSRDQSAVRNVEADGNMGGKAGVEGRSGGSVQGMRKPVSVSVSAATSVQGKDHNNKNKNNNNSNNMDKKSKSKRKASEAAAGPGPASAYLTSPYFALLGDTEEDNS